MQEKKYPKEFAAWGILFNETLGLTQGDPIRNGKLEYTQVIILRSKCYQIKKEQFAQLVTDISLKNIYKCIEAADYSLNRLEPEVISWISDSRAIELFYALDNMQLEKILGVIKERGIKFLISDKYEEDTDFIALQPSVKGVYNQYIKGLFKL